MKRYRIYSHNNASISKISNVLLKKCDSSRRVMKIPGVGYDTLEQAITNCNFIREYAVHYEDSDIIIVDFKTGKIVELI